MECTTEGAAHELGPDEVRSLYAVLCEVPDYRRRRGRRYEAAQVLVIMLLAKLAGEHTIRAMIRTFAAFPDQALELLIKPL
jgi:hypothetical protein